MNYMGINIYVSPSNIYNLVEMDFQKDINYESDRNKQNISIDVTQARRLN